jgi:PAS domain S-box-containing protein
MSVAQGSSRRPPVNAEAAPTTSGGGLADLARSLARVALTADQVTDLGRVAAMRGASVCDARVAEADAAAGEMIVIPDVFESAEGGPWREWASASGGRAIGRFPLAASCGVAASLDVCAVDAGAFDAAGAARLGAIADVTALALGRVHARRALDGHAADLRRALDAGHMGVFDWDMLSGRVTWDENHCRLFGLTPAEFDDTYDAFARCVHPDDLPEVEWAVAAARQARAAFDKEFRVVRPSDGSTHWVAARGSFAYNEAGRAVRMSGFAMDVDRRHTAEQTARAQRDQIAHLLRLNLLSQLASGLAHEINQPLSAISNFAGAAIQMHRGDALTAGRTIEVLTEIDQQAQRAGAIVRRLREFMAKRGPRTVECDLNALVAEALALLAPELAQARVKSRFDAAPNLPPVRVDRVQVQQVLVNLIKNAIDAMDDAPPRDRQVTLSTIGSVEQVIVRVSDTGKGIAAGDLPRLFDSFFSTKSTGMGLGLNISRSIIEAHGGQLTASNHSPAAGRGATFEFVLPLGD